MNILPYQADIAERMLVNTEHETIHPDAQFLQTANGYWIAWHQGLAALLAPNTPPDIPCFWVEGADSLKELASMIENGDFDEDEIEEFDADSHIWHESAQSCSCGLNH